MFKPADLGLPWLEFKPHQAETIAKIASIKEPIVFVLAPTGAGKSGIAIGSARLMRAEKTVVVCHQRALQEQYLRDWKELKTVKGRGNFPCLVDPSVTAEDGRCTITSPGECDDYMLDGYEVQENSIVDVSGRFVSDLRSPYLKCPYYKQLWEGLEAPISIHNYCLAPETRVLTADLRWVRIDGLQAGDELVGFDEELNGSRHKRAVVEAVSEQDLECFEIETDQGTVIASAHHKWVVSKDGPANGVKAKPRTRGWRPYDKTINIANRWIETQYLRPGDCIARFVPVWEDDNTSDRHYLAGFFDGEGSVSRISVSFAQNEGPVLNKVKAILDEKGFQYAERWKRGDGKCRYIRLMNGRDNLRFLGQIRPTRLTPKADNLWVNRTLRSTVPAAVVKAVRPVGVRRTVGLKTSTGTLVAEGMLTHNSYWLMVANGQQGRFSNLDLLVLDEGHLLEGVLKNTVKITFAKSQLNRLDLSWPTRAETIAEYKDWAQEAREFLRQQGATKGWRFHQLQGRDVAQIKRMQSVYKRLDDFVQYADDEWIIDQELTFLGFRPVWVHQFGRSHVFRHARKTVLLSATFRGLEMECDLLGIDPSQARMIEVPSTFPAKNRPVIFMPTVKVSYGMSEDDENLLLLAVKELLDRHPNDRGLIHTSNYNLAHKVIKTLKLTRLITHGGQDRQQVIDSFNEIRGKDDNRVLVSPSITTGLDLPDDAAKFVIWLKLPFASKADEQVKRRLREDPSAPEGWTKSKGQVWYMRDTLANLIQGCGRHVRHENDVGISYILDANIKWFWAQNKDAAPGWFREAVRWEDPAVTLERQVQADVKSGVDYGPFANMKF